MISDCRHEEESNEASEEENEESSAESEGLHLEQIIAYSKQLNKYRSKDGAYIDTPTDGKETPIGGSRPRVKNESTSIT